MVPDAESVIVAYLRDEAFRASTATPDDREDPWVRVTLLDDPPTDGGVTDHHIEAFLQIDCYAGTAENSSVVASGLSIDVREALRTMKNAVLDDAVVTGARSSRAHIPDTAIGEAALERYIISATVWMRGK